MKAFLTVFRYTLKENASKKSFIITTAIICFLVIVLMIIPGILAGSADDGSFVSPEETISSGTIYICDVTGDNTNVIKSFASRLVGYKASFITSDKVESIKEAIKNTEKDSLMLIKSENGTLSFEYIVKGMMNGADPDYLSELLEYSNRLEILKEAGLSNDLANRMTTKIGYTVSELSGGSVGTIVVSIIILLLIFFAIYFYGYGVSMSVASEKTSRVMELLITSAKPSKIVLGKSVAMGVLGLCQFTMILISGIISYALFFPKDFNLGGMAINFSMLSPFVILMIFIYFILGYSLFAMLQAVTGASVSKAEDLTSAMMPVSFICLISFYLGYVTFMMPNSFYAAVVSIIPFSAPFAMPLRLINGGVPAWHILLSLIFMLAAIVLISYVSIKVYSNAVLHYGSKKSFIKMFKTK